MNDRSIAFADIVRLSPAQARVARDALAIEEPLEIRVAGRPTTVTMRTPGSDEELARGFLFAEGLLAPADIAAIVRPTDLGADEAGNVIDVQLRAGVRPPDVSRNFYATSSCGVCGKSSLAAIDVKADAVRGDLRVARAVVASLPERLAAAQPIFAQTGGLHAAALFAEGGALEVVREDVGRHNAVDKVVGWALENGRVPAARSLLLVSGRASFEVLQKVIAASVPIVCAVSAPTSLAVALAQKFGVTLVGFLRGGAMNIYANAERIV